MKSIRSDLSHGQFLHLHIYVAVIFEEKKVDVSLQDDKTVIKLSTWTDDLGWCAQKTMALDAVMLDELHRVITAARLKIKREKDDSGEEIIPSKILEFPKFA